VVPHPRLAHAELRGKGGAILPLPTISRVAPTTPLFPVFKECERVRSNSSRSWGGSSIPRGLPRISSFAYPKILSIA
jgi:hypothetical protein